MGETEKNIVEEVNNKNEEVVELNNDNNNVIKVENLTKEFKELKAVDNLSFQVEKGEILGLLGPNGSGKSTTINCILALLDYKEGNIEIFNKKMNTNAYDLKKDIGVVFQEVAVFDELTVYENIDYFCGLYIKDKKVRKQYIEDAIKLVGLEDFKKFYPKKLSGGLLRRLNIACGIAHKPKLIFLDEPTVAVDPQSRNNILDGIKILRDNGATIVYTTHYMEEVETICDRVIILDKGSIIASGTIDELKALTKIEEKVSVDVANLDNKHIDEIKQLENVHDVTYANDVLVISFKENDENKNNKEGKNYIVDIMNYMKKESIKYSKIYSERPTLNDVFLELTGKELRD